MSQIPQPRPFAIDPPQPPQDPTPRTPQREFVPPSQPIEEPFGKPPPPPEPPPPEPIQPPPQA